MRIVFVACVIVGLGIATVGAQTPDRPTAPALGQTEGVDTTSVQSVEQLKQTMAVVGLEELPGLRQWQRDKSARIAVLSSMVLPGLGQVYNGRKWKAGIAFGLFTFYMGTALVEQKEATAAEDARNSFPEGSSDWNLADSYYQFHKKNSIDNVWWAGAVWFISLLDAFVDANLYDVRAVDPKVFKGSNGKNYVGFSIGM